MKKISELNKADLEGKIVLVRVDYNVPVQDGVVLDDLRIKASFETINFLKEAKAHVILISHIENKIKPSLDSVAIHINKSFEKGVYPFEVHFRSDLPGALYKDGDYISDEQVLEIKKGLISDLEEHQIVLFENLRVVPGEKENNDRYADILASFADVYINDAFSVCHREHASLVSIPKKLDHYAGFSLVSEINQLNKGLHPTHPFVFILGGAKFETKLPLIEKFIGAADKVIVGGALFNDVLKAKGYGVGKSLVSSATVDLQTIISNPKLIIPKDVVVQNPDTTSNVVLATEVQDNQVILDMGPDLISIMSEYFESISADVQSGSAQPFVLWNGPMGNYEMGFKDQTIALAKLINQYKINALLGGGDTTAAIAEISDIDPAIYVSTGGGAMIEYLLNETLPGIDALA